MPGGGNALCVDNPGRFAKDPAPFLERAKGIVKNPLVWFFGWCFACGIAAEFAPYNVLSLHLAFDRGMAADEANHLLSASRLASPLAVIAGGLVAPRIGMLRTLRIFFLLHGICFIMMGMPYFPVAVTAIFLQALMPSFVWPALLSILPARFPAEVHPTILSLVMPAAAYIGTGLAPKFLGVIGDHYSFSVGFIIFGIISILTVPLCSVLKSRPD